MKNHGSYTWKKIFGSKTFDFMRKPYSEPWSKRKTMKKEIPQDICTCYQYGQIICKFCCNDISKKIDGIKDATLMESWEIIDHEVYKIKTYLKESQKDQTDFYLIDKSLRDLHEFICYYQDALLK